MPEETRTVRTVETGERKDRILIVEDEDNARKGYEQLLQRWGYDVLGVGTAEDALAKFSSFQPDTLIADVELPGMNGLDLLQQLGDELHDVPAIIITGKGSEERAVAAIESGAFWYIEKPLKGSGAACACSIAPSARREMPSGCGFTTPIARCRPYWRSRRKFQADARRHARHRNGRAQFRFRAHHRRNRFRQRNRRAHHSQAFSPRVATFCGHQLLGDSRNPDGKRNFRPRTWRVHRCGGTPYRLFRTCRRRHLAAG